MRAFVGRGRAGPGSTRCVRIADSMHEATVASTSPGDSLGSLTAARLTVPRALSSTSIASRIGALPPAILRSLVRETQHYSFDFYMWKRAYVLKKNWLAHTKRTCVRCNIPLIKAYLGKTARRTFFCENCQVLYT